MPYDDASGFRLYFLDLAPGNGARTAVLLLHALGSCGEDWLLQVPSLRSGRRILAPDLRGHGRSQDPGGWPTIEDYAEDIAGVLQAHDISRTHVVGFSLGGAVGLELALRYPERLASLTLINGFARLQFGAGGWSHALRRLARLGMGDMEGLGRLVANGLFPRAEQASLRRMAAKRLASNTPRAYLRALAAIARFDRRSALAQIKTPTFVLAGELDRTIPMQAKLELAQGIPGARLKVVPESGHATPLDAPDVTNVLLAEFFDQVDGAPFKDPTNHAPASKDLSPKKSYR